MLGKFSLKGDKKQNFNLGNLIYNNYNIITLN